MGELRERKDPRTEPSSREPRRVSWSHLGFFLLPFSFFLAVKEDPAAQEPSPDEGLTIAPRPVPPLPPCDKCGSTGKLKLPPPKAPYVLFETDAAPDPSVRLGFAACAGCPRGKAAQAELDAEKARLVERLAIYQKHEEQTGLKFLDFETGQLSGHFQTTLGEARECALALARLGEMLAKDGLAAMLPDNPSLLHLIVCENAERFGKYLEYFTRFVEVHDDNWLKLAKQCASFGSGSFAVIRRDLVVNSAGSALPNLAVFCVAHLFVNRATNGRAPDWYKEGFSNWCESLLFVNPRCYSIRYEDNPLDFEVSWAKAVAEELRRGKAHTWLNTFRLDLIGMQKVEYQICWSVVRFLATTDKEAFAKLPGFFKDGLESTAAVEKAYGKPIGQLEAQWKRWATQ